MYGVELVGASNCLIINNTVTDVASIMSLNGIAFIGFRMSGGESNVITKNTLSNNLLGMYFGSTTNNTITENQITYTATSLVHHPDGISFYYASGNHIYHNTFNAAVGGQVGSFESNNTWDNGFPSGGNYWSDYGVGGSNFTKIDDTRIYDCPYLIDDGNIDYYPLVEPYTASTPLVAILSRGGNYDVSSVPLSFTVDQPDAWMGYSLDGAQIVTLSGNQTLTDLANGQHTVMVYANDSFGNRGSAEFEFTVSVPLSPVLVGGVVAIVVAAVAVTGVIYYSWRKKKLLT
jgi:parallel beta-helix repeat protein